MCWGLDTKAILDPNSDSFHVVFLALVLEYYRKLLKKIERGFLIILFIDIIIGYQLIFRGLLKML